MVCGSVIRGRVTTPVWWLKYLSKSVRGTPACMCAQAHKCPYVHQIYTCARIHLTKNSTCTKSILVCPQICIFAHLQIHHPTAETIDLTTSSAFSFPQHIISMWRGVHCGNIQHQGKPWLLSRATITSQVSLGTRHLSPTSHFVPHGKVGWDHKWFLWTCHPSG